MHVRALRDLISQDAFIFICPSILQEVLQGIRSDHDFELVKRRLLSFEILNWHPVIASLSSVNLYRKLRKDGITIRKSNDCLIAAFAIHFELPILHIDRDFYKLEKYNIIPRFNY